MELFNLLFAGQAQSWLQAALLVCLFWVALIRPDRIQSLSLFRASCVLFAISLVAPTMVHLYVVGARSLTGVNPLAGAGRAGSSQDPGLLVYLSAVPPLLIMLSFLMAIESLLPRRPRGHFEQAPPVPPP